MPSSEKQGKKPPSSGVLPGEFGMVLGLGHRDVNHRDVIDACQRGDEEAFRVLFETHKDRVYSIALRYAGDSATAMDIAQDTFLKLLSNIQQFRGESSFESWLYRMVVNSCLDYHRKRRRFLPLLDEALDVFRSPRESTLHDLLREEQEERVQQIVAQLPEEQRIVVVLRYTDGLSYEEIADLLGCRRGTVASRLNRAHKALERRLSHVRKEKLGKARQQ
ncbi:MAG TPA: sigma-70 family RNA polymerase sigma factor [Bryobacteraceae bacterium]|jgi:RNA polymerase sigma-70 factor (ECF subfamily)|nr:sigma-70 family RNA polymerase sigma factor [Bryobacteraceae bacterium]